MKITKQIHNEMSGAFNEIQQPRTNYELEKLIVGAKFTEPQAYAQCVLEMQITYDNLRLAKLSMSMKQLDIDEIKGHSKRDELEKAKLEIELEQTQRAVLGAEREFQYLYHLWKKFPTKYTRKDLNNNSPLEFEVKLKTQALQDIQANGRVGVSSLEGLRQMGIETNGLSLPTKRDEIETKYLEEGDMRIYTIIPSEKKLTNVQLDTILPETVQRPTNAQLGPIHNVWQGTTADNYNSGIERALSGDCTHILTIEDDQVLEPDTLIKLFEFSSNNPDACVSAWYPKRQKVRQGVHIKLSGGNRKFLDDDGEIHSLKTMAMGCSIYPSHILRKLDFPYCKTTNSLSQDSYLSQKLRDAGVKLLCDTSLKIGHKDKDGTIYY